MSEGSHVFCIYNVYEDVIPKTRTEPDVLKSRIFFIFVRKTYFSLPYNNYQSVQKTKSMVFKGRDTVRTEIVTDNEIIDQVNLFNYLGNMISYEGELDIGNKLNNI